MNDTYALFHTLLYKAYLDARRKKRMTQSQLRFEIDAERRLEKLYNELILHKWKPSPCIRFVVKYPVKREVFASEFADRVVHHLYFNAVAPLAEKVLIADSYSCRKGKGTLYGVSRLEHHVRSCSLNYTADCWVLKLDIQGYFMSIPRERLRLLVHRLLGKAEDKELLLDRDMLLWLTDVITLHDPMEGCKRIGDEHEWDDVPPSKCLSHSPKGVGLPIGDLTSQLFSNIYLNELDQYVKRELKVKHYGRYVDDFFLVGRDKAFLCSCVEKIRVFLSEQLGLMLHPKKILCYHAYCPKTRTGEPIPFLGAEVRPFYRQLSRRTTRKVQQLARRIEKEGIAECWQTANSYLGQMKHYKAAKLSRMMKT
ncbi:MAG: RNA-directed DNA polymerase [Paludibacteraceae bacterium]|nr:RNA-directed DNA polymerase [Paludibacteraceae bacterium]